MSRAHLWVLAMHCLFLAPRIAIAQQDGGQVPSSDSPLDTEILVKGMLLRAESITSGRFTAIRSTGFSFAPDTRTSQGPYIYSLSGSDWARQVPWEKNTRIVNRGNKRLSVWQNPPSRDGSISHGALFAPSVAVRNVSGDSSPFYAGTFWLQSMFDYVKQHAKDGRHVGREHLGDIETEILEWKLNEQQGEQLMSEFNEVIAQQEGFLRIYVAPRHGYVLPRIERMNQDRVVAVRWDSKEFHEVADGIWFPFLSKKQWFNPKPAFYEEYKFKAVELINDEIPKTEFEFNLPAGTRLSNERVPGKSSLLETPDVSPERPDGTGK